MGMNLFKSESTKEKSIDTIVDESLEQSKIKTAEEYFSEKWGTLKSSGYNEYESILIATLDSIRDSNLSLEIGSDISSVKNKYYADKIYKRYLFLTSRTNIKTQLQHVMDYAKFLTFAKMLTMCNNNDTEDVYSSVTNSEVKIQFIFDNYKIGCLFTKDIIRSSNEANLLEDFISGMTSNSYLIYVELVRDCDNSKQGFNLSLSDPAVSYTSWSKDEQLLFDMILNNISNAITHSYKSILNRSYEVFTGKKFSIENYQKMLDGDKDEWRGYLSSWTDQKTLDEMLDVDKGEWKGYLDSWI